MERQIDTVIGHQFASEMLMAACGCATPNERARIPPLAPPSPDSLKTMVAQPVSIGSTGSMEAKPQWTGSRLLSGLSLGFNSLGFHHLIVHYPSGKGAACKAVGRQFDSDMHIQFREQWA